MGEISDDFLAGGALATLSALRVIHERVFPANAVQLFTFGSPRVGNLEFAQYASDQLLARYKY
jgi:predicted lipase